MEQGSGDQPRSPPSGAGALSDQEVVARSAGGAWRTTLLGLLGRAAGLLTTVLVTYFLRRDEYGHANLAMILAMVVGVALALSPQQALLTLPGGRAGYERLARRVHAFVALSGVLVALALGLSGPWLTGWLGQPEAAPLLWLYCGALVLERFGMIPILSLRYHMHFQEVSRVELWGDLAYSGVTLGTAAAGAGGFSLPLGMAARHGVRLGLLLRLSPGQRGSLWPRWPALSAGERGELVGLLRRCLPLHGGALSEILTLYIDNVFIGKVYGAAAQGMYAVAYTLMMTPADTISLYSATALTRALGVRDERVRRDAFLAALRYLCVVLFPIAVGTALTAGALERTLLPARWQGLAPLCAALCAGALSLSLMRLAFAQLSALQRMRAAGLWQVLRLSLLGLGLLAVLAVDQARAHLDWVAWGVSAAFLAAALASLWQCLRAGGLGVGAGITALLPALTGSLALGLAVVGVRRLSPSWPAGLQLLAQVLAGGAAYVGALRLLHRETLVTALRFARRR